MHFTTLNDWLSWQETLHPSEIDLGLERVATVFASLHPDPAFPVVVTIAGTNGKGSSVAMLDAIYRAAGYRVGCYTSPHLFHYNERIVLNGQQADDESICEAFARINKARGDISLTYFEFGTLAALDIFLKNELDIIILEVGLGGRLDAVNIIDADVSLITSISHDHSQWLGDDVAGIAKEKAGIMRSNRPVVSSGKNATKTLASCAKEKSALLFQLEKEFSVVLGGDTWNWQFGKQLRTTLPKPALFGAHQLDNAAGVLMVTELLKNSLPVGQSAVREGLMSVQLAGRFQVLPGEPVTILDVAHNVDAMTQLSQQLRQYPCQGRTLAVLGMLSDKDIKNALGEVFTDIDEWFLASLPTPRSEATKTLASTIHAYADAVPVHCYESVQDAFQAANKSAGKLDRILVFGSFYTVAEAMPQSL